MVVLCSFLILPISYYVFCCFRYKNTVTFDLFDRTHTMILKGIAIAIIVLVHFSNLYFGLIPSFLAASGVAIFLICSGFGVNESWNRSQSSTKIYNYWKNKLVYIWFPYLIVLLFSVILNEAYGIEDFVFGAFLLKIRICYGWYLQFLFASYIIFFLAVYLSQRFRNKHLKYWILGIASMGCLWLPNGIYAEQAASFLVGVLISDFRLHKKTYPKWSLIVIGIVVYIGLLFVKLFVKQPYILDNSLWLLIKLTMALWLIHTTYVMQKYYNTYVFQKLGWLSYALYLLHGNFWFLIEWNQTMGSILYIVVITLISVCFTLLIDKMRILKPVHHKSL